MSVDRSGVKSHAIAGICIDIHVHAHTSECGGVKELMPRCLLWTLRLTSGLAVKYTSVYGAVYIGYLAIDEPVVVDKMFYAHTRTYLG